MLRGAGAGLGVAALAPVLGLGGRPVSAARARLTARAAGSRGTDFGQGWKFALVNPYGITDPGGTYASAQDPAFDDSRWRQLDVPHDWSIELAPVDNASTSSATGFLPGVPAFNGRALVIIRSAGQPGGITVSAASAGLAGAKATLTAVPAASPAGGGALGTVARTAIPAGPAVLLASAAAGAAAGAAAADASYSGSPATVPAAMLDGDPATGWSNYYDKAATADLRAVSVFNPGDWVSVAWPSPQSFDSVHASFTVSATLAQPASITVSYWDGATFVPVRNLAVSRATASDQPTTLTFDPVRSSRVRLDMTSAAPGTGAGFLRTVELGVLSGGTAET